MPQAYDVIVVGGGPAALSAALYAARRGLKVVTLAEDIGGQAATTGRVENYPGLEPTDGLTLIHRFRAQAEASGATVILERVERLSKTDQGFTAVTPHGEYVAPTAILAFGLSHKKLAVPGEDRLMGHGVSYCSLCDAPLFKGKNVAVIGGGNSAMDTALALSHVSPSVTLITKHPELRGERVLLDHVRQAPNITVLTSALTKEIVGQAKVSGLKVETNGQIQDIPVAGVFVEIGYHVKTDLIQGLVDLDDKNQIKIDRHDNATSVPGLFAAGDITDITQKQIVISAGEGAKAGIAAAQYLERLGRSPITFMNDWTHTEPMRHRQPPTNHPSSQK